MWKFSIAILSAILAVSGSIARAPDLDEVKAVENVEVVETVEVVEPAEVVETVETVEEVKSTGIDLTFVGDVTFVNPIDRHSRKHGYQYAWEHVSHHFQDDDISLINLETPISTRGEPHEWKEFTYRSSPKNIGEMKEASIEYVNLANNHLLDYGRVAFADTLKLLNEGGIKYSGGGMDIQEANKPAVFEVDGKTVGVISYSRVVPKVDWYATTKRSGIVGAYDSQLKGVLEYVKEYNSEFDLLVLSIHWGEMYQDYPRKQEEVAARKLIDAGADLIIGHHPHCIQGVEIYKGKPIFYSMGNFIFPNLGKNADTTFIGKASFEGDKFTKIEMVPCKIVGGRPVPLEGKERDKAFSNLNKLSKKYGTVFKDGVLTGD